MADYIAKADVKRVLTNITGTDYDTQLDETCTRASRIIDRYCKRGTDAFKATTSETRYYHGSGTDEQWIDDAVSVSSVGISDDDGLSYYTLAVTDYDKLDGLDYDKTPIRLLRMNPNGDYTTFYSGRKSVKVTGVFGYSTTVPDDVAEAALIIAVRLFRRGQAGFSDTAGAAGVGEMGYARAGAPGAVRILGKGGEGGETE